MIFHVINFFAFIIELIISPNSQITLNQQRSVDGVPEHCVRPVSKPTAGPGIPKYLLRRAGSLFTEVRGVSSCE